MTIYHECPPRTDRPGYFLKELNYVPQPDWSQEYLLQQLREVDFQSNNDDLMDLMSGAFIQPYQLVLSHSGYEA